jgi:hypothetical protein
MLTMLLGGLWHGASWNFVLWGGCHGAALAAHKLWTRWRERVPPGLGRWVIPAPLAWLLTLLWVMVCWVPFRSRSLGDTVVLLKAMAGLGAGHYQWLPTWLVPCLGLCVIGHLVGWCIQKRAAAGQAAGGKVADGKTELRPGMSNIALGGPGAGREPGELTLVRPFRMLNKAFHWLGAGIEAHELSGAWVVPQRVTVAGAYVVSLALLVTLFFAPLNGNPFIYFQF